MLAVVAILILPCYVAQGMADFTYGNEAVSNSPGTAVYEAEQQMNEAFGQGNMMLALVPLDGNVTEQAMCDELEALPYVRYALGLASVLPDGIPESFLPESVTGLMHGEAWASVKRSGGAEGGREAGLR